MEARRSQCEYRDLSSNTLTVANFESSISGVGVRKYYAHLGYELDGPYMSKKLDACGEWED